jgi:cystathionine beta-lyase
MAPEGGKRDRSEFDFDRTVDRCGTSSYKWDYRRKVFGREDVLPMWVADMDFRAPEPVIEALEARARHGVFGYTARPAALYEAVVGWFERRYGWRIEREWILATPGVVPALDLAIEAYTAPEDGVIIQPPVYYPFRDSVRRSGRSLINNRLVEGEDGWRMDLDALREDCRRASMLVLCSPHNPVGRVWTAGELEEVVRICAGSGVTIFSDEIHADIVYAGSRHIPTPVLGEAPDITVSAYATSKTFNLAGLQMSLNVIPDPELRARFREVSDRFHMGMSNVFAIESTTAAYSCGEGWLEALLAYLADSFDLLEERLEAIPGVTMRRPEGTYLAWLDCRGLGLDDDALEELFVQGAGLGLNRGSTFGPGGGGHMRMNLACPRSVIAEALDRLERAVSRLQG